MLCVYLIKFHRCCVWYSDRRYRLWYHPRTPFNALYQQHKTMTTASISRVRYCKASLTDETCVALCNSAAAINTEQDLQTVICLAEKLHYFETTIYIRRGRNLIEPNNLMCTDDRSVLDYHYTNSKVLGSDPSKLQSDAISMYLEKTSKTTSVNIFPLDFYALCILEDKTTKYIVVTHCVKFLMLSWLFLFSNILMFSLSSLFLFSDLIGQTRYIVFASKK